MGTETGPIVVGVDGSVFSRAALRWAIIEGQRWSVPVVAVLVWRPVPRGAVLAVVFQRLLDHTVRDVHAPLGGPAPLTQLVAGTPADELVRRSRQARLLALGSHGHGWLCGSAAGATGSVAEHCLRHAVCPVLVIPAGNVPVDPGRPSEAVPARLLPDRYGLGPI